MRLSTFNMLTITTQENAEKWGNDELAEARFRRRMAATLKANRRQYGAKRTMREYFGFEEDTLQMLRQFQV